MFNYNKEQLFKVSLFLIIIFFSFYRSPYIFINGRFFSEEGLHFAIREGGKTVGAGIVSKVIE